MTPYFASAAHAVQFGRDLADELMQLKCVECFERPRMNPAGLVCAECFGRVLGGDEREPE
jgi:hypothetical protein